MCIASAGKKETISAKEEIDFFAVDNSTVDDDEEEATNTNIDWVTNFIMFIYMTPMYTTMA